MRADQARVQWAIGIAERELGHLDAAATELRAGIALADEAGDAQLSAGLKMTLALVVARLGRSRGRGGTPGRRGAGAHRSRAGTGAEQPRDRPLLAR